MSQENTKKVLGMLSDIAILQNKGKENLWGVLFNTIGGPKGEPIDEAFVLATPPGNHNPSVMVRVSEFGPLEYDKNAPYFHYKDEGFLRNQWPITPEEIHRKISTFEFPHRIRFPYGNLINFIYENFPDDLARTRVRAIIKANRGEVPPEHILCKFNDNKVFKHPKVDKPFVLDKYSSYPYEAVTPGSIYVCRIIDEKDDAYIVSAKNKFFKGIQIGLYETVGGGYFPESDKEILDFNNYPKHRVFNLPIPDINFEFHPIHIQGSILMDCLKLFTGFELVDILMGANHKQPILITGVREGDDYPNIECFVAPLDPAIKGWRC